MVYDHITVRSSISRGVFYWKPPKQQGSNLSNLITMPITTSNGTAVHTENICIGIINSQLICN